MSFILFFLDVVLLWRLYLFHLVTTFCFVYYCLVAAIYLCVIDSNEQSILDIRSDRDDKSNYDRQYVAKLK